MVKNQPANAGAAGNMGLIPGGSKGILPWRKRWQPTSVLLPRKSHGQRSLADYSPWGRKQLDTTEQLTDTDTLGTILVPVDVSFSVLIVIVSEA